MKLHQLLQAYEFDELMPVINEMFPGTAKYREPLKYPRQFEEAHQALLKE